MKQLFDKLLWQSPLAVIVGVASVMTGAAGSLMLEWFIVGGQVSARSWSLATFIIVVSLMLYWFAARQERWRRNRLGAFFLAWALDKNHSEERPKQEWKEYERWARGILPGALMIDPLIWRYYDGIYVDHKQSARNYSESVIKTVNQARNSTKPSNVRRFTLLLGGIPAYNFYLGWLLRELVRGDSPICLANWPDVQKSEFLLATDCQESLDLGSHAVVSRISGPKADEFNVTAPAVVPVSEATGIQIRTLPKPQPMEVYRECSCSGKCKFSNHSYERKETSTPNKVILLLVDSTARGSDPASEAKNHREPLVKYAKDNHSDAHWVLIHRYTGSIENTRKGYSEALDMILNDVLMEPHNLLVLAFACPTQIATMAGSRLPVMLGDQMPRDARVHLLHYVRNEIKYEKIIELP